MTKSLLLAVLVVEASCWTAPQPAARDTTEHVGHGATRSPATCTEGGERLLLVTCRAGNALEWTVTNQTSAPLWAFVAPPAGRSGKLGRENAAAQVDNGNVVLTKIVFPPIDGELVFTGAVLLAPGESDHGRIPVGERLDTHAANLTGVHVIGTTWVRTVALEIGFAEQRPLDDPHPVTHSEPLVVLAGFQRSRQELVRSSAVAWR